MATNNLLVNNEYKVLHERRNKVERSPHNLSQSRKFPVEIGKIYPIFCRKTLPSDSFKIDANILVKQLQPLLVPQMVSFSVQTAFYWVDYSLAWPEFEYFLINQRGDQTMELPYVHLRTYGSETDPTGTPLLPELSVSLNDRTGKSAIPLKDNLRTFIDITSNSCNEKIDALPFWAYQTIIRDYYTNIDRLSETEYNLLFPSDASKHYLKPGENFFYNNNTLDFDYIKPHNVRGDYFVNSYPTPIRGETPVLTTNFTLNQFTAEIEHQENILIDTFGAQLIGFSQNTINTAQPLYTEFYENGSDGYAYQRLNITSDTEESDNILQSPYLNNVNPNTSFGFFDLSNKNFNNLKNLITNPITFKNIQGLSSNLSITTRELRLLDAITRKREIDILMKPRLKNYLHTYFGVDNYKHESLYQPIFIGSTTQQILINDIEQTTTTDTSPLGRQGATAISLADNFVGDFYCRNYGCLLGVMFILPDFDYEPAIPHEWSERTPDDFYNPEFAHLSMQAILNKELFVSNDESWNNQVLGYGGVYDYYRTSNNYVSSLFLSPDGLNEDLKQFAQVRRFSNSNKPEITTAFLNSHNAFDMSVFAVPSMPPFICQAVTRVRAVRPLPELATPESL